MLGCNPSLPNGTGFHGLLRHKRYKATAAQTQIYENDRPEKLVGFIADDVPLEPVIAIDVSANVQAAMPAIKAAASELLSAIPSNKPFTVMALNDQMVPIAVRQTDPTRRLQALEKLDPRGGTALYDAVTKSLAEWIARAGHHWTP